MLLDNPKSFLRCCSRVSFANSFNFSNFSKNERTVSEYFNLDRFGEVVLASDGDSNALGTDGRLDQYTQFNEPNREGFATYQDAIAKRRIVLDDGQTGQNPDPIIHGRGGEPLSADNTLRDGDTVTNLSGILSFGFGDYRLQPTAPLDFQPSNPRPEMPEEVGGTLKVVSFNVLNFFTTLDDPSDNGRNNPDNPADNTAIGLDPREGEYTAGIGASNRKTGYCYFKNGCRCPRLSGIGK